MKLSRSCCRCCAASLDIARDHARPDGPRSPWRRPRHGCLCRHQAPADRCRCAWCAENLAWGPRCGRRGCEEPESMGGLCQPHRVEQQDRDRARYARSREVRQPPRPPFEKTAGVCSLCGTTPLPPRRRSWCSDDCVLLWTIATSGQVAHYHLSSLHGLRCWRCDAAAFLEVEHVRPLWSLTPAEREELRWWLPFNLQLLCSTCHGEKSRHETTVRAAWKRGEAMPLELPGWTQPRLV